MDFASQTSSTCQELYILSTIDAVHPVEAPVARTHILDWKADATPAEIEWVQRNGFRVFRFPNYTEDTLGQVLATVSLFLPALEVATIPEDAMKRNVEFLATKGYYNMTRRVIEEVTLNETDIHDGDFFGVRIAHALYLEVSPSHFELFLDRRV